MGIYTGPPLGVSSFVSTLDRPLRDLSWKVAHGVLYTADRLIGFGYDIDATCIYVSFVLLCCPLSVFKVCVVLFSMLLF